MKCVLLNKLSCLFGFCIYWNYWWKMTYWVVNTIHHLRWYFVQQFGGEVLHFSLHLWTAMNTSFGFFCFAWIKHIFTWNCHLSPDLNYEQRLNWSFYCEFQKGIKNNCFRNFKFIYFKHQVDKCEFIHIHKQLYKPGKVITTVWKKGRNKYQFCDNNFC